MLSQDDQRLIRQATAAYRNHEHERAQRLIAGVLSRNPDSLEALKWATEFATTSAAQVTFLRRILTIDPNNRMAKIQLEQTMRNLEEQRGLSTHPLPALPSQPRRQKPLLVRLASLLGGGTLRLLPILILVGLVAGLFIYGYLFYMTNELVTPGPGFDTLQISAGFENFKASDREWKITYEDSGDTRYSGWVRTVVPFRNASARIITHDILVTSGDFADPALVKTTLTNHMFTWKQLTDKVPEGTINLIHAVPSSQAIYEQLLQIRPDDQVEISGREIKVIDVYNPGNIFSGSWQDSGCNTLLIKSVKILDNTGASAETP